MNQIVYEENQVRLKVRKSPLIVLVFLYAISFLCFGLPLFGFMMAATEGNGIKFGFIVGLGLFSLIGFYMLRNALWNHYGEETILFTQSQITYIADYRWFKDGKKILENQNVVYLIKDAGYEDDNEGVLVISDGKSEIISAVKIPKNDLERLVVKLVGINQPIA